MYNTKVVTGKIIEIRDDHVVTLQGDTVSTYHLRYYKMLDEEPLPLMEPEYEAEANSVGLFQRDWKPFVSWMFTWKKSANRA
ncbi:hypothetical protein [Paenibacillus sp. GCM10028914]|uniref:hypothetical protein n=1 Tax=Paenibacillus sp. GCM10028914 TaxID=3273416 RepID=UPI00361D4491